MKPNRVPLILFSSPFFFFFSLRLQQQASPSADASQSHAPQIEFLRKTTIEIGAALFVRQ
jgi:hypothetical protein